MKIKYSDNQAVRVVYYLTLSILSFLLISCSYYQQKSQKPNVILIVADDLGYDDLSCYNPKIGIYTPNIDKLAASGLKFTDAHASSSYDLPSRYALITGRYGYRLDMLKSSHGGFGSPLLDPFVTNLPTMMRSNDYITYLSGKWNLGLGWSLKGARQDSLNISMPVIYGVNEFGFDHAFYSSGASLSDAPFFFVIDKHIYNLPETMSKHAFEDVRADTAWVSPEWVKENADVTFAREACEFISSHSENYPESPFFLYFTPYAPRSPYHIPEFAKNKSKRGPHGDLIWLFDWMVGELVTVLKEKGVFDNTLIIITSDNGAVENESHFYPTSGSFTWRGYKGQISEAGHRVPFIAIWPDRIKPGQISNEVICHTDVMATLASITKQKLTYFEASDGYDISKLFFNEEYQKPLREATVHHAKNGLLALRYKNWKVVYGDQKYTNEDVILTNKPGMVFDLSKDPHEENNLWNERQDVVRKLQIVLDQYVMADRSAPVLGSKKRYSVDLVD